MTEREIFTILMKKSSLFIAENQHEITFIVHKGIAGGNDCIANACFNQLGELTDIYWCD